MINVPRREIGPATLEKLGTYANERQISMHQACGETGLAERLDTATASACSAYHLARQRPQALLRRRPDWRLRQMVLDLDYENWIRQNCSSDDIAAKRMGNVWFLIDSLKNILEKDESAKAT
ncbi:hypothetical protein UMZ34_07285 [Halopseudomonas pachastrellae]|nr:hypothetical protein UMZ34_07285 [Halopseudomonas pachastrellae]